MFFNKIKYEPKVGDQVLLWSNVSNGKSATLSQEKPWSAILKHPVIIEKLTEDAFKANGEWWEKESYYLEVMK